MARDTGEDNSGDATGGVPDLPAAGTPAGGALRQEESLPLDLVPAGVVRRRAIGVAVAAVVLGAAVGGLVGFFAGRYVGLGVAVVVALPLLAGALVESRRRVWLAGGTLVARTLRRGRVDLARAERLDLLVTTVRGRTTVSMLASGPPRGSRVTVPLAMYQGAAGVELGILALRRLADNLARAEDTRALVFSQLLVAVLRAEARGDLTEERPLHRIAALVPDGRWGRRVQHESLSAFVASLG